MKPYIFFLDIDETLATQGEVPEENVRAIKEAQEKGHFVFINTGRSFAHINDKIKFAAPYDGFLCGLGSDIRFHGKQLFSQTISTDLLCRITEIFLKLPEHYICFEGEDMLYHVGNVPAWEVSEKITSADDWKTKYPNAKISKFIRSTMNYEPLSSLSDTLIPYVHPTYAEYSQKGLNKASAMHVVAEKLGVETKRCVAIGDSLNDREMLDAAGIAVVMENGTDDVKAIADFITGSVREAGVAQAIRKLIYA